MGAPAWFTGLPLVGKVVTGVTVLAVGAAIGVTAIEKGPDLATVTRVVDGDTLDVRYQGEDQRVRLLNINTPETLDPDKGVECLGPEASQYLKDMLPAGTKVRLEFDQELRDRYGRLLAGVFLDGKLVNAEIARAGMGAPVVYEPNRRFYDKVMAASDEAFEANAGLYDETIECTLLGQISEYKDAVVAATQRNPTTVQEADSLLAEIAAFAVTAAALRHMLDVPDAFPAAAYSAKALAGWTSFLDETDREAEKWRLEVVAARDAEVQRIEAERIAAEEAARVAAEAEAARLAEEAARVAAEEAARVAEERTAAKAAQKRATTSPPQPKAQSDSGGGSSSSGQSGYTGCRKYAPGGKTWTPIPCP